MVVRDRLRYLIGVIFLLWVVTLQAAFTPFIIEDIQVEGLQRIAVGTVFNYLPLQRGDQLDTESAALAVRRLYQTGFFRDVVLEQDGNQLLVHVAERPSIANVEVEGNEDLPSEQLLENLERIGFSEGKVFNQSLLDKVVQELTNQYMGLGKYNIVIDPQVIALQRNRVEIRLVIDEGDPASILRLKLLGNVAFSDYELMVPFESEARPMFQSFSSDDQYSRQKIAADLETLRSYYLDRGHIHMQVKSAQVSITSDKKDVYISINIEEGDVYHISDIRIDGDTIVPKGVLRELVKLEPGDLFARNRVTAATEAISEKLGEIGYAFANVNPVPSVDEVTKEVVISFMVDPGRRFYVNRINLSGHDLTRDEVIRREIRQMEFGLINTKQIKRSRTRLNRLGFFDEVSVNTPIVPGSSGQVDVDIAVKERDAFGSLNVGIGYSSEQGMLINASVKQDNFLGSGQQFGISINNSDVNTTYQFSLKDPYATLDGISRGYSLGYSETDASEDDVSDYVTNSYFAEIDFGVPISEFNTLSYAFRYERTDLIIGDSPSNAITEFCNDLVSVEDCLLDTYQVRSSFSHDTRNRALFPNGGGLSKISAEVALSIERDSPTFYKLHFSHRHYLEVVESVTLASRGEISYADVYGQSSILAPYERFYAGGINSVRAYRRNSLGAPETFDESNDPAGGDFRILAGLELLFPPPFSEDANSMRLGLFIDAGNVYNHKESIDMNEIRYSAGLSLSWLTPIGPLKFSYGRPLNANEQDVEESFQFTIGSP